MMLLSLSEGSGHFSSLSSIWGASAETESITVASHGFPVTINLKSALVTHKLFTLLAIEFLLNHDWIVVVNANFQGPSAEASLLES